MNRARVLAHNRAVKDDRPKASLSWEGVFDPLRVATGHIDDLDAVDAREWASEHDDEIKEQIDQLAVHERGPSNIGYAVVEDGEIVDYSIDGGYLR